MEIGISHSQSHTYTWLEDHWHRWNNGLWGRCSRNWWAMELFCNLCSTSCNIEFKSISHSCDSGISTVQSLSRVRLLGTAWTAARQDSGIRKPNSRKNCLHWDCLFSRQSKEAKKKKKKRLHLYFRHLNLMHCCFLVTQSCPTLCNPMDCSMPGLPVLHHPSKFAQVHVHCIGDAA